MELLSVVLLSLKISFFATLLQTPLAIYLGFYLAKAKGKWAIFLNGICLLPLVVTPLAIGFFVLYLFQPRSLLGDFFQKIGVEIIFNWKGAMIAVILVSIPLYIQAAQSAFASVPQRLQQLSLSLGNNPFQTFFKITLPLCKFGIIRGALLSFTRGMGEFGATVVVAGIIPQKTETIASAIFRNLSIPDRESTVILLVATSLFISFFFLIFIQWLQILAKQN
jgi:molybdate transport system permease protein